MEPFSFEYGHPMEYTDSTQSSLDYYTPPPYDEMNPMIPFDYQGCFPFQGHAPQGFYESFEALSSFGVGTRPVPIPIPSAGNDLQVAQLGYTPSPYSSPPDFASPYSKQHAILQSPVSVGDGDNIEASNDGLGFVPAHTVPSVTYPKSISYSLTQASLSPSPVPAPHARGMTQRSYGKKSDRPFKCGMCKKGFNRLADAKRHETTIHNPRPEDCPVDNCVRKGSIGFPRHDHLIEHLRTFHNRDIPKRCVNKKHKANFMA